MTDRPHNVPFEVRMFISQYAREAGTAKAALQRLIDDAGYAMRELGRSEGPGEWSLAETAMQYERAAARLNAIKELKAVYDRKDAT